MTSTRGAHLLPRPLRELYLEDVVDTDEVKDIQAMHYKL